MLSLGLGKAEEETKQDSSSSSSSEDEDEAVAKPLPGKRLQVEQVKVVDTDGNLKVVYPSKTDLPYAASMGIEVKRS